MLTERYEELRKEPAQSGRWGWHILVEQGLNAWMAAWCAVIPRAIERPVAPIQDRIATTAWAAKIATIWAEMIVQRRDCDERSDVQSARAASAP